jgi:hypothetical protein
MIKICVTIRNRLAITKKCLEAIKRHSILSHQIYVYDNNTTYLIDKHFKYFQRLYKKKEISQITFTTIESTFNAFSKAVAFNMFGRQHEEDPQKDSYDFLLLLDNDVIVTPGYDQKLSAVWKFMKKKDMKNVKLVGQKPGGIKGMKKVDYNIGKMVGRVGKLGGSGLWSMRTNFFRDIGFLDLKQLVGYNKRHDQLYWQKCERATNGEAYIFALQQKLGIHCGKVAGSVCNKLTSNKDANINFEAAEKEIDNMDFDSFYKKIINDRYLVGDW